MNKMPSAKAAVLSISSRIPLALKKRIPPQIKNRVKSALGIADRGPARRKSWQKRLPNVQRRLLDNPESNSIAYELVLEAARISDTSLWELPSSARPRLATSRSPESDFVRELNHRIEQYNNDHPDGPFTAELREAPVKNNLYEFDQEEVRAPELAQWLSIFPTSPGGGTASYLRSRGVALEFIEENDKFFVIPVAGRGPRVYPKDMLTRVDSGRSQESSKWEWPFPIDLVYTWVDSADEIWQRNYASVADEAALSSGLKAATNSSRWQARDELRFSLRSVEMYAPFMALHN